VTVIQSVLTPRSQSGEIQIQADVLPICLEEQKWWRALISVHARELEAKLRCRVLAFTTTRATKTPTKKEKSIVKKPLKLFCATQGIAG
jgi:hypothetical protein